MLRHFQVKVCKHIPRVGYCYTRYLAQKLTKLTAGSDSDWWMKSRLTPIALSSCLTNAFIPLPCVQHIVMNLLAICLTSSATLLKTHCVVFAFRFESFFYFLFSSEISFVVREQCTNSERPMMCSKSIIGLWWYLCLNDLVNLWVPVVFGLTGYSSNRHSWLIFDFKLNRRFFTKTCQWDHNQLPIAQYAWIYS